MDTFTIDGVQVPRLPDFQSVTSAASPVTNETETEGGTIVREIVRDRRRELKARWTLGEAEMHELHGMAMKDSVTVETYMPDSGAIGSMVCYVDAWEPVIVKGGARWQVELTFKEY